MMSLMWERLPERATASISATIDRAISPALLPPRSSPMGA